MTIKIAQDGNDWDWERDETGLSHPRLGYRIQQILISGPNFSYDQPLIMERRGAAILPYVRDENETFIILIRQKRPIISTQNLEEYDDALESSNFTRVTELLGTESWEVPRGLADKSESLIEAALKEAREESGIPPDLIQEITEIGRLNSNTTFFAQPVSYFSARLSEKVAPSISQQEEAEMILAAKWFKLTRAIQMIFDQRIICGMTSNALMLLDNYLRNQ